MGDEDRRRDPDLRGPENRQVVSAQPEGATVEPRHRDGTVRRIHLLFHSDINHAFADNCERALVEVLADHDAERLASHEAQIQANEREKCAQEVDALERLDYAADSQAGGWNAALLEVAAVLRAGQAERRG